MNKAESKYFNTAVRMDEAFLELLQQKDFEYITVKEICEKAEVNRSTFYLHYETMGDLLSECLRYMGMSFLEYFKKDRFSEKITTSNKEELYLVTPEYLVPYLEYIKDNRRLFQAAVEKTSAFASDQSMSVLFENIIDPIMEKYHIPEKERKYLVAFYIEGIIAIVKVWIRDNCEDSIEYMVDLIQSQVQKPSVSDSAKS